MGEKKLERAGTETWQPEYLREHHQDRSKYLSDVAATDILRAVATNAMQLMALKSGDHVLEVGCGNGMFLPRLAEAVGSAGLVVGIDHSDVLIEEARNRTTELGLTAKLELRVADAYCLPFGDGAFAAAHCERVLMHLEDPTAALREMARVVRPGGTVVAAEPDWLGIRVDHPDRDAFNLVYVRALRHRQPEIGLTLRRRMVDVGLRDVVPMSVPVMVDHIKVLRMYGLNLEAAVDALVAEGAMDAVRLQAVVPALEEASSTGRYYGAGWFHVLRGVVP